jgi:hypothetical protein
LSGGFDPGHSSIIKDRDPVISFGPKNHEGSRVRSLFGTKSTNTYSTEGAQRGDLNIRLNTKSVTAFAKMLPKMPYAAGTGLQCAGATSMAALLSGHYMLNLGLLLLNAPQVTYFTMKYEQYIRMSSILTTIHTTK